MNRPHARGFTLVELVVTVAIAAIVLSMAGPAFTGTIGRMRLEGAINELSTDLQFARAEALRKNVQVTLVLAGNGASYTIAGTASAKVVALPTGVTFSTVDSSLAGRTVTFDSLRGQVAASRALTGASSATSSQLRVDIDTMGRVKLCSSAGNFPGYSTCT